ncbi:HK97 gp10 family phage protein [Rhodococcoides trifolii]|nr:HK97 gp10 family phage protein [Rhodococcus trifolii]
MERALQQAAVRWGDRAGQAVVNAARANCPTDEGRLRSSITHTVTASPGRVRLRVGSGLEYARYVHEGTGIYGPKGKPIVPVTAKALKFRQPKMMGPLPAGVRNLPRNRRPFVFAKSVKGSPPSPFLSDALKDVFGTVIVRDNPRT